MVDLQMKTFNEFLRDLSDIDACSDLEGFVSVQLAHGMPAKAAKVKKELRRRFNPLLDLDEDQFRLKYRFKKDNMRRIIEMVRDDLEGDPSLKKRHQQVPVDLQIMTAIRYWGSTEHPEVTAMDHGITLRTLAKVCKRVAAALSSKASRYIRMPATFFEKECVTNAFEALAGMPHVIGAVAHSNVRIKRKEVCGETEADVQSATEHVLIQVVSDVALKIRDLDCKQYSSDDMSETSDMFTHTRIKERFEQNEFRGRVLLGDYNLPCTPFLFTPVQWPSSSKEHAFNQSLAISYTPVTECINMWKRRFRIMTSEICASYGSVRNTIVALALLHNMAIEWNDRIIDSDTSTAQFDNLTREFQSITKQIDTNARTDFIKSNF